MFFSLNFEEVGGPRVPPQGHCRALFWLSLLVVLLPPLSSSFLHSFSSIFRWPASTLACQPPPPSAATDDLTADRAARQPPALPPSPRLPDSDVLRPRRGTDHRLFCPIPAGGALAWRPIPSTSACPRAFPFTSYSLLAGWQENIILFNCANPSDLICE